MTTDEQTATLQEGELPALSIEEIKEWFLALNDHEAILLALQGFEHEHGEIDSDVRHLIEKPWKWAPEAYDAHRRNEAEKAEAR